jgi:nucleoid-associated protein YgaU
MALEKAQITNTVTNEVVPVMFNPEEYTTNRDINYAQTAVPGLSAPIIQFVNGNMQTLDMELFLDTYESHKEGNRVLNQPGDDVRKLTTKITELMNIDATIHAPPVLLFTWGSLSFTCVLARVSQHFTMFRPDGMPVRAKLQVTFNEFRNVDLEAKEIKRETADYSKLYKIKQDETLSSIAASVYKNPRLWRPIALRNGIDNPRSLPVGEILVIPSLPFRNPETGEVFQP